ncbi:PPA1309 family protein [Haloactinopolyspora sp.]|uniref:PPA1309 family protein n=1 Tax=Haloactinopolyspora sp. TaxID=1966353 RepID=UPI00263975B9|nr:PPA1309 family protein [Haloactinopolyspora sp.]
MSVDDPGARPDDVPSALTRAVAEIERHVRADGWDQQARLYALAPTAELVSREPELATKLGLSAEEATDESLTPIEQDIGGRAIEELLPTIEWPDTVTGCALVLERIVLPPGAEDDMPAEDTAAAAWAQQHPARSDVRVVVGVLRDGSRATVLRVRGHEEDADLVHGAELSPELGDALADTLT